MCRFRLSTIRMELSIMTEGRNIDIFFASKMQDIRRRDIFSIYIINFLALKKSPRRPLHKDMYFKA